MGADWLQLFHKTLCDEILGLNLDTASIFLGLHLARLGEFSEFRYTLADVPVGERVKRLLEGGETEATLKARLVDELCFGATKILIDYWGCYVEAFSGVHPSDAIPDYALFPERQEQSFVLLRPQHVDTIFRALDLHRSEVTIMNDEQISAIRDWRDMCTADPSYLVAYVFDV